MKHNILVKFKTDAPALSSMLPDIRRIFAQLEGVEGIHEVTYKVNCIDRPNRYHLLIQIDMDRDVLSVYDDSEAHHEWKKTYGPYIESKAIFDYE